MNFDTGFELLQQDTAAPARHSTCLTGVTMGVDYAEVYTIVNDILAGYRNQQHALGDV